jgi:hypothetical protein
LQGSSSLDEWDPPIVPYDCYGPGTEEERAVVEDGLHAQIDDLKRVTAPPGVATP